MCNSRAAGSGLCCCNVDATIVGTDRAPPDLPGISLAPCTPNRHCGFCTRTMQGETLDHKFAGRGQLFRILAFNVRGEDGRRLPRVGLRDSTEVSPRGHVPDVPASRAEAAVGAELPELRQPRRDSAGRSS
jgi:hypothetical protein